MKCPSIPSWVLAVTLVAGVFAPPAIRAADEDAQVKRTEEQVQQLRRELEKKELELRKKEQDLQQLKQENQRLRKQKTPATVIVTNIASPAPARPVTPLAGLPPLGENEQVEAHDLTGQFAADPAAAATRYHGKVIRVHGRVGHFGTSLITRNYQVVLDGPAAGGPVAMCAFNYVDKYRSVFTHDHGRTLVARSEGGAEQALLNVGDTVVIQGTCKSFQDGEVSLSGCRISR